MKNDKLKTIVASIISHIFHPEIMILLTLFVSLHYEQYSAIDAFLISLFLLCFMQTISKTSIFLKGERKEDRTKTYLIVIISYIINAIIMSVLFYMSWFWFISITFVIGATTMAVINHYTKISVHCGTASLCASLISIIGFPIGLIAIAIIPAIAWSRVYLKKHDCRQAIYGTVVGMLLPIILFALIKIV